MSSTTPEPNVELDARTLAQGQSLFFARLPIELRRMVYEFVMGEEVVHLTLSQKRRFGHCICHSEADNPKRGNQQCSCRVLVGGKKGARLDGGAAALVRTCRRMYVLTLFSSTAWI